VRDGAEHVVSEIRGMGKQVILMSGDNEKTAQAIARKVRIANVLSEVSPEAKAQTIKKLQSQSRRKVVAMVGDCINDGPALTQAEFGIAMGSATDVAMALGHVIMMKSDLEHVILALKIGMYAFKKIKENLAMSFTYNTITMSIAAGVFYRVTNSLVLSRALAALGWIVSDSLLFGNSFLVRRFHISNRINSKGNH
jgi:P-type Cu+ transporter